MKQTRCVDSPIQIVKEQCWLNEALVGCQWSPESPPTGGNAGTKPIPIIPAEDATEDELQAVLSGMSCTLCYERRK